METLEERPVISSVVEIIKTNTVEENNVDVEENNVCHKSNGVDSDKKNDDVLPEVTNDVTETETVGAISHEKQENIDGSTTPPVVGCTQETDVSLNTEVTEVLETPTENEKIVQQETELPEVVEVAAENVIESIEKEPCNDSEIITETIVEMNNIETVMSEQVQFETEILVEKNDNDVNENLLIDNPENDPTNNILSELGPNIELSEVLRSSDISENNNSTVRQEVFNKEELLDILEGNDMEQTVEKVVEISQINHNKMSEAQIALQQLNRLKTAKKRKPYTSKGKRVDKKNMSIDLSKEEPQSISDNTQPSVEVKPENVIENKAPQTDNIVNVLVMDWQDDEPIESNSNNILAEGEHLLKDSEQIKENQVQIISSEELTERTSIDSTVSEDQPQKSSKSGDESAPRRLSRVIKKKVIFDPDNPDTFTKGKSTTKIKEMQVTKDQTPAKKVKIEQTSHRSKSKSPLSKLQWKKPSPRNSKQCKRLSEVDKLLMDEGAVNMIYQLTPEAPKGRKNMKTKAEFIKKLQSSTPDGKEMKFRERKKESLRYEDGEAKKILGGKHRISLNSSVKSPSVSEDFETHSADDSIIYRRHSSSSYSSSCMSPRRLSDVDTGSAQNVHRSSNQLIASDNQSHTKSNSNIEVEEKGREVFKAEAGIISNSEIINKDDCMSIKEKLNSKLSLALNKRKRESTKFEKPAKQKKAHKAGENVTLIHIDQFKFISVSIDQRLAVISIQKTHLKICVEVLKELEEALNYVDSRQDISITLLVSQCGTLCSSLDLSLLLDENKEIRANHAFELAESVRCLLSSLVRHSKLVCCGVWGACAGVALALVALSDVALSSERASFSLSAAAPVQPGAAALTARCPALPQAMVNDLVIFGQRLSASEALQGGLISRVLWPDRFDEQVYNIAKDIAAQPTQTVLLKKKLLSLKKNSEAELTFLSCLEAERDLLVEYWTSVEGQELLRATLDVA
ncbi:uncharacterized protein LOC124536435 [Vanessa cardui]|uniref:uncharacterized protein LOC124536435 n=1 Tax=Vanessa cardui TaxID=171605 RepID=UPI001F137D64|nr:uncharacterized protein LOC124536435 [Vanessa cardui]